MIVTEHYLTLWNDKDGDTNKEKYLSQVWNILLESYKDIGGIASIKSPEALLADNLMWKLVTRNNKVVCCAIYKITNGSRKLVAGGTDSSSQGKADFYKMCQEDVVRLERNAWAEISGSMEGIFLFKLNAIPVPVNLAEKILNDRGKTILQKGSDGFHYTRKIGDKVYEKIMFGNVPEQYRTNWEREKVEYRRQYDDYNRKHPEEVERRKRKH